MANEIDQFSSKWNPTPEQLAQIRGKEALNEFYKLLNTQDVRGELTMEQMRIIAEKAKADSTLKNTLELARIYLSNQISDVKNTTDIKGRMIDWAQEQMLGLITGALKATNTDKRE